MTQQKNEQRLADEISALSAEVRTLRDAVDELREILTYAVINGRLELSLPKATDCEAAESLDIPDPSEESAMKRQAELF